MTVDGACACCRWGHVLLSSWLDIAEEKTIMYQAGMAQPLLQPLLTPAPAPAYVPPPPAYLPPLESTRDLAVGGVVAQGKGYQQITSWQVTSTALLTACHPRHIQAAAIESLPAVQQQTVLRKENLDKDA